MAKPLRLLLALGFSTAVAQAVLLREGMAMLGGSELAWGAVLGLWLLGMGAGARLGVSLGAAWVGKAGPLLVLAAAGTGAVLLRAAPALVGAVPGEVGFGWRGVWLWGLAVLPAAVAGGWCFPVLAGLVRSPGAAAEAYALEAAGAFAGGVVFTFLLAAHGSAASVVLTAGVVSAALLASARRVVLGVATLVLALAAATPAGTALERLGWAWSRHPGDLGAWSETRQQRLEFTTGPPPAVFADGRLLASWPPPYAAAVQAHVMALLHPGPRRVLALGGLGDGTLARILEHPVDRLDFVEDDAKLLRLLPRWLGPPAAAVLADPRSRALRDDPLEVVRRGAGWDLILLLDGDPTTLRRNRTRTAEFFTACAAALRDEGVLVVRVGVSDTYVGGLGGRLLSVLRSTLADAFPVVAALPGDQVLLVASRSEAGIVLDPEVLRARLHSRGLDGDPLLPEMLPLALDPGRAASLAEFLDAAEAPVNHVDRPRAVLLAAALHGGRGAGGLLATVRALAGLPGWVLLAAVIGMAAMLVASGARGRLPGRAVALVVGGSSMGWWLLLLMSWQATMGSVYAEVGVLSAAFMGGVALGATAARRWRGAGTGLASVLAGAALLSAAIAAELPLRWPLAVVPLLLVGGALTGAAFPGIAALLGGSDERRGAGRGFAADEVGAGIAAVGVGLVALPWVGMRPAAGGLAILCAAAALGVALAVRRRRDAGR